ncbi:hypothetical protein QL285_007941 [Trifolium repens]|nr:hypothetical protein QL285_007941 [Trifolium repens]
MDWASYRIPSWASSWWKNIIAVDKAIPGKNWFVESVSRKVGNGMSTSFWNTKWLGDETLAVAFPRLFSLSNAKDSVILDFSVLEGEARVWSFSWRQNLFRWEEDLVRELVERLELVRLSSEDDCWFWRPGGDVVFSVKSSYILLSEESGSDNVLKDSLVLVLNHIWDNPTPSKVIAFSWQLLYDRIPTRNNLEARGVLSLDIPWECLGCVGVSIIIPPSLVSLFELVKASARNAKIWRGFIMVWHATLWAIWKAQNSAIFASGHFSPMVVVEDIKVSSWKWCLTRLKVAPCMYYEWIWDPGDCLMR